jgi:tetratricopeptide (TPR) repeat protein
VRRYERAVALQPDYATAYKNMGAAYFAMERFEEGLQAYRTAHSLDPTILGTASGTGVQATGVDLALQCFYFAKICAAAGRVEVALDFLVKGYEHGFRDFDRVANDPDFAPLLAHPRYLALRAGRLSEAAATPEPQS